MDFHVWICMLGYPYVDIHMYYPRMDIHACMSAHGYPCMHMQAHQYNVPKLAQEQGEPALRMHFRGTLTLNKKEATDRSEIKFRFRLS